MLRAVKRHAALPCCRVYHSVVSVAADSRRRLWNSRSAADTSQSGDTVCVAGSLRGGRSIVQTGTGRSGEDEWTRSSRCCYDAEHSRASLSVQTALSASLCVVFVWQCTVKVLCIWNKLWYESTTNPVPVLRIAALCGFSELTKNRIRSSHDHSAPSLKISCKSVQPFSRNRANKETKKERNRSKTIPRPPMYRGRGKNGHNLTEVQF